MDRPSYKTLYETTKKVWGEDLASWQEDIKLIEQLKAEIFKEREKYSKELEVTRRLQESLQNLIDGNHKLQDNRDFLANKVQSLMDQVLNSQDELARVYELLGRHIFTHRDCHK